MWNNFRDFFQIISNLSADITISTKIFAHIINIVIVIITTVMAEIIFNTAITTTATAINNNNNNNNINSSNSNSNSSIKNNFHHNSGNNDNNNIDNISKNLGTDSNISRKVKNDLKKIPKIVPHESLAISTIAVQQSFSQAENFRKLWENYRWSSQLL